MERPFEYQGYTVALFDDYVDQAYLPISAQLLRATGATHAQITACLWQDGQTSSSIYAPGTVIDGLTSPTDESIELLMNAYAGQGLDLHFKVSILPRDQTWSGDIRPADISAWFSDYKEAVVHWAALAESHGVTHFIITNEMTSTTNSHRAEWLDLLSGVRSVFSGQVGVNAQEPTGETMALSFGDALDFIGVSLYPVTTHSNSPTVQDLKDGWSSDVDGKDWLQFLHDVHNKYDKPVQITELAFWSRDGSAASGNYALALGPVDEGEQQDQYEAFFQTFSNLPDWFEGVTFWEWISDDPVNSWRATDPYLGPTGAHIIDKLAESTVTDWMHGLRQTTGQNFYGDPGNNALAGGYNHDTFFASDGIDLLDGNNGLDRVVFDVRFADVTFRESGGNIVVSWDGNQTTVVDIEFLQFQDVSRDLQSLWFLQSTNVELVAATYQFFAGLAPTGSGFEYLISSSQNPNDLNDAYYEQFNTENRYINFASNLGTAGDGAPAFDAKFGALSFEDAIKTAYLEIVGQPLAGAALAFFLGAETFYQSIAQERVVRSGVDLSEATKIVAIGSILNEAMKSDTGAYGEVIGALVDDLLPDGISTSLGRDLFAVA